MADFKKHSVEDLHKEIAEKRESLRTFRFGSAGSRSRNTREGRSLRKDIARLLTEVTARNLPTRQAGLPAGKAGIAKKPKKG